MFNEFILSKATEGKHEISFMIAVLESYRGRIILRLGLDNLAFISQQQLKLACAITIAR